MPKSLPTKYFHTLLMTDSQRPLLFDAHAHLVADDQQAYPRNPMQRAANAPYRAPGVIGKPGGHHGPNPINEIPDVSRMLTWMQAQNVDGAVAVQKRMIYRYDNSYILDSSDRYPDIFSAVVILGSPRPKKCRDNGRMSPGCSCCHSGRSSAFAPPQPRRHSALASRSACAKHPGFR